MSIARHEFQLGLKLRYNIPLNTNKRTCPALKCKAHMDAAHIDSCKFGGVIIQKHNMARNILARHIQEIYGESSIVLEPMLEKIAIEHIY